jgi:hypothetical protein
VRSRQLVVVVVLGHDRQAEVDRGRRDHGVGEFDRSLDTGGSAVDAESSSRSHDGFADGNGLRALASARVSPRRARGAASTAHSMPS